MGGELYYFYDHSGQVLGGVGFDAFIRSPFDAVVVAQPHSHDPKLINACRRYMLSDGACVGLRPNDMPSVRMPPAGLPSVDMPPAGMPPSGGQCGMPMDIGCLNGLPAHVVLADQSTRTAGVEQFVCAPIAAGVSWVMYNAIPNVA